MEFNDRLRELRKRYGYSQVELAKKLGVSPATIGMYETGERKPSYEMLENMADFFNVDIDYLAGRNDKSTYYADPAKLAAMEEAWEKHKILFDAAENATADQIKQAAAYLEFLKKQGR